MSKNLDITHAIRMIDYDVLAKIIDEMIREYTSECQCEGYPILKMCSMCGRVITLARLSHKIYQASEVVNK